ncbi:MAG: hypothetical protein FWC95_06465 [Defluviitaleaceae bacterium]|nr:hypothetical protein [Defluviitaleaceae bacterium]
MKNIFSKSTLRQPIRSFFLFALITAISFAFVLQATEYIIVVRETERIGAFYRSVGVITPMDGVEALIDGYAAENLITAAYIVSNSGFVEFIDNSRIVSTTIPGVFNMSFGGQLDFRDDGVRIHNWFNPRMAASPFGEFIVAGEVVEATLFTLSSGFSRYYIRVRIEDVIAGYVDNIWAGRVQGFVFPWGPGSEQAEFIRNLTPGDRIMLRGDFNAIFVMRLNSDRLASPINQGLGGEEIWYVMLDTEAGEPVDFAALGLADIEPYLRAIRQNQESFGVIGTRDMTALPTMMGSHPAKVITGGRAITYDDYNLQTHTAVIHSVFANTRGISVGDVLRLDMRHLNNPYVHGAVFMEHDPGWMDYAVYTLEVEVVGLFQGPQSEASHIYVPLSILPDGFGQLYMISFILANARDEEVFLAENADVLATLGAAVFFMENDADLFWNSVQPVRQSSMYNALIFSAVLVMALLFSVFIFMRNQKRNFAVLRALGSPRKTVIGQSVLAICTLSALAIFAGGAGSFNMAMRQAAENLAAVSMPEGAEAVSQLAIGWLFVMCVAVLLFVVVIAAVGAVLVTRKPVLELIQGNAVRIKKAKRKIESGEVLAIPDMFDLGPPIVIPPNARRNVRRSSWLFILRHMRRSSVKSALTIVLAAAFVIALGWMYVTIERNTQEVEYLFDNTIIIVEIMQADESEAVLWQYAVNSPMQIGGLSQDFIMLGQETENFISNEVAQRLTTMTRMNGSFLTDVFVEMSQEQVSLSVVSTPARLADLGLPTWNTSSQWGVDPLLPDIFRVSEITTTWNNPIVEAMFNGDIHRVPDGTIVFRGDSMGRFITEDMTGEEITMVMEEIEDVFTMLEDAWLISEQEYWALLETFGDVQRTADWLIDELMSMRMLGIRDGQEFFDNFGENIAVEWEEGFDESIFRQTFGLNHFGVRQPPATFRRVPVVIPLSMALELGVGLGDEIQFVEVYLAELVRLEMERTEISGGRYMSSIGVVRGIYYCGDTDSDVTGFDPILLAVGVMESRHQRIFRDVGEPHLPFFSSVRATIDPARNRELYVLQEQLDEITRRPITDYMYLRTPMRAVIHDTELMAVVGPLEQMNRMMAVLYPVTIVLSAVIGTGLATIIMFQNAKNAAIMRVLGSPKVKSRTVLCVEQVLLCMGGLVIGLAVLALVVGDIAIIWELNTLLCAALYLLGASLGAVGSAISITRKMPLELLQVRE